MQLLNRAVMVVKPKQPLLDWVNGLDDSDLTLEDVRQDCPAYLIPEIMDDDDQDIILAALLPEVVENELAGWWQDESDWPQINDLETFKQWFDVSFHSMAFDLEVEPLEREAFDPFIGLDIPEFFSREYSDEERAEILEQVGQWAVGFSHSDAYRELPQESQEAAHDVVTTFAELMYAYFLVWPEEWDGEALKECCLSIMPEKIMAEEAYFRSIAPVLAAFLTYLASEEILDEGDALAAAAEEIGEGIVERGADPTSWGLTKTFVMQALDAGVDVTDEEELQRFIDEYNRRQGQALPDNNGGPRHQPDPVGRNNPCPCGSGRKYKHCCGP